MIKLIEAPAFFKSLYHYAWFVSFAISAAVYFVLMRAFREPGDAPAPDGAAPLPAGG